jgi:tape measure domain-containing protein
MSIELEVLVDGKKANSTVDRLRNKLRGLDNVKSVDIKINSDDAQKKVDRIKDSTSKFKADLKGNKAEVATGTATSNVQKLGREIDKVKNSLRRPTTFTADGIDKATGQIQSYSKSVSEFSSVTDKAARSTGTLSSTLLKVTIASGTAASLAVFSDILTNIDTKINLVAGSTAKFANAFRDVTRIAVDTRTPLADIATLYTKIASASGDLGVSQKEIARVTSTIGKSLAVSGTTMQEARSAILQLGQGLASGVLAGEELRAVLENAPALARAIAEGMGKAVGDLRKLGEEGKLTSEDVFKAILAQTEVMDAKFKKVGVTFAQAFQNMQTSGLLLFRAISNLFFSSTGGPAEQINSMAVAIGKFAERIQHYASVFEIAVIDLMLDTIDFFEKLPSIARNAIEAIKGMFSSMFDISGVKEKFKDAFSFLPEMDSIKSLVKGIVTAFVTAGVVIAGVFKGVFDSLSDSFAKIGKGVSKGIDAIKTYIKEVNKRRDVEASLPSTKRAQSGGRIYSDSGMSDRRGFTMVGIQSGIRNVGTNSANTQDGNMLSALIQSLTEKPRTPENVTEALASGAKSSLNDIVGSLKSIKDYFVQKFHSIMTAILATSIGKSLQIMVNDFRAWFDNSDSAFIHAIKQMLGIQDKVKFEYMKLGKMVESDPEGKVARGPKRGRELRVPGHDMFNALPSDWQVPVFASISTMIGLALHALSKRLIPIFGEKLPTFTFGVYTTVLLLYMEKILDKQLVADASRRMIAGFREFVDVIVKGFLGSGPGGSAGMIGSLTVIAKLALLFQKGRDIATDVLKTVMTGPTKIASVLTDRLSQQILQRRLAGADNDLATARQRGASPARIADFVSARQEVNTQLKGLNKKIDESSQAFKAGATSLFAGIGGTAGTFAGYQIGVEIVKGMGESSEWAKYGTIIASALTGQAIGAFIGVAAVQMTALFTNALLAAVSTAVAFALPILLSPIGVFVISVGALILALSNWQSLKDAFLYAMDFAKKNMFDPFVTKMAELWDGISKKIKEHIDALTVKPRNAIKEFTGSNKPIVEGSDYTRGEAVAGGVAAGGTALTIAALAPKVLGMDLSTMFQNIRNAMSASLGPGFLAQLQAAWATANNVVLTTWRNLGPLMGGIFTGLATELRQVFGVTSPYIRQMIATVGIGITAIASIFSLPVLIAAATGAAKGAIILGIGALIGAALYYGIKYISGSSEPDKASDKPGSPPVGNNLPARATGGHITGPGTGTSDSILARLSNGEYVVNAKATSQNKDLLERINSGLPAFANGGMVKDRFFDARDYQARAGKFKNFDVRDYQAIGSTNSLDSIESIITEAGLEGIFALVTQTAFESPKDSISEINKFLTSGINADTGYLVPFMKRLRQSLVDNDKTQFGNILKELHYDERDRLKNMSPGFADGGNIDFDKLYGGLNSDVKGAGLKRLLSGDAFEGGYSLNDKMIAYPKFGNKGSQLENELKYIIGRHEFGHHELLNNRKALGMNNYLADASSRIGGARVDEEYLAYMHTMANAPFPISSDGKSFMALAMRAYISNLTQETAGESKFLDDAWDFADDATFNGSKNPFSIMSIAMSDEMVRLMADKGPMSQTLRHAAGALMLGTKYRDLVPAQYNPDPAIYGKPQHFEDNPRYKAPKFRETKFKLPFDFFEWMLRGNEGKDPEAYATGGSIKGAGTGTSDSILARLSNGEFVVNAKSTAKYQGLLEAINSGAELPGFSEGGKALFERTYRTSAERVGKTLGVSPDIILRHWGLETGYGAKIVGNNLGNMIAVGNQPSVTRGDKDANGNPKDQKFRVYKDIIEFEEDYSSLIKRRYKLALGAEEDMFKFSLGLQRGEGGRRWAEDPKYAEKLLGASVVVEKPLKPDTSGGLIDRALEAFNGVIDSMGLGGMRDRIMNAIKTAFGRTAEDSGNAIREAMSNLDLGYANNVILNTLESSGFTSSIEKIGELTGAERDELVDTLDKYTKIKDRMVAYRTAELGYQAETSEERRKLLAKVRDEAANALKPTGGIFGSAEFLRDAPDRIQNLLDKTASKKDALVPTQTKGKFTEKLDNMNFSDAVVKTFAGRGDQEFRETLKGFTKDVADNLDEWTEQSIEYHLNRFEEARDAIEAEEKKPGGGDKRVIALNQRKQRTTEKAVAPQIARAVGESLANLKWGSFIKAEARNLGIAFGSEFTSSLSGGISEVLKGNRNWMEGPESLLRTMTASFANRIIDVSVKSFVDAFMKGTFEGMISRYMASQAQSFTNIGKVFEVRKGVEFEGVGGYLKGLGANFKEFILGETPAAKEDTDGSNLRKNLEGLGFNTLNDNLPKSSRIMEKALMSTPDNIGAVLKENIASTEETLNIGNRAASDISNANIFDMEALQKADKLTNTALVEDSTMATKEALAEGNEGFAYTLSSGWTSLRGTLTSAWTDLKSVLSTAWDILKNVFNGLFGSNSTSSSVLGGASSVLGGLFGGSSIDTSDFFGSSVNTMSADWDWGGLWMANGGRVAGPGTGTSDSIAAMLSNGEYVINAASTKKFLPILSAINDGSFAKFAEGGLVSSSMSGAATLSTIDKTQMSDERKQQVFNLNITGDVSRQTKKEIMSMLPQIANGVNMHNREISYRGR